MRRIWITRAGGPEVLTVREEADPVPGQGEVRVRVRAAGVNFADVLARQGLYPDGPGIPCVIGYEVSGVVDAVGTGCDPEWRNQPVVAITRFGGYSDAVVVPESNVFPKPETMTFEEAAAVPVTYLTAYQLVVVMGGLQATESILIHNAGGGVGMAALDIARHIGARIYGTASSYKHGFLRDRGVDYVIDYRNTDWFTELHRVTENRGVELIIDPLGPQSWKKSFRALRSTGRLGIFGISSITESGLFGKLKLLKLFLQMPFFHASNLLDANRGVFGVNMGHLWHEGPKIALWMETILKGYESGWVRPHIDSRFRFSSAAKAHEHLEKRRNIGKVILIP
jgi:NADPH:quinone reductase-like Zn-dependent oxidoreductase